MKYAEFREQLQKESDEFVDKHIYIAFGFSREEVIKKLKEDYNITDPENLVGLSAGCYCYKDDYENVKTFYDNIEDKRKNFVLNNLHDSLVYEFWNHESALSGDYLDMLKDYFMFTDKEIKDNLEEIKLAIKDYEEEFFKYN